VIATEWTLFRTPDFEKMSSMMKHKIIFDEEILYDVHQMKESGFIITASAEMWSGTNSISRFTSPSLHVQYIHATAPLMSSILLSRHKINLTFNIAALYFAIP